MDTIRYRKIESLEALQGAMVTRKEMMMEVVCDSERLGMMRYTVIWDGEESGKNWVVIVEGFGGQEMRSDELEKSAIGNAMKNGKCWIGRKGMIPKSIDNE